MLKVRKSSKNRNNTENIRDLKHHNSLEKLKYFYNHPILKLPQTPSKYRLKSILHTGHLCSTLNHSLQHC